MDAFHALVLSLPTRNSTLRMRLWRSLKESGCGVLRDGVYLLPQARANGALAKLEDEIRSHGGFAMTLRVEPRSSAQLEELRKLFDRSEEYGTLARKARREHGRGRVTVEKVQHLVVLSRGEAGTLTTGR